MQGSTAHSWLLLAMKAVKLGATEAATNQMDSPTSFVERAWQQLVLVGFAEAYLSYVKSMFLQTTDDRAILTIQDQNAWALATYHAPGRSDRLRGGI